MQHHRETGQGYCTMMTSARFVVPGVALLLLMPTVLGQATTLFYPFGSEAGDDNMTYTGGGTDLVTFNLTFGFNWFGDQNNPTMTISKHGQASFDPGWTPSLSTSVDLTSVNAGTLIAPLADIFPSFGRGEVYFRESRAVDDITRANNDVHGVSRGSGQHTIDKVIVVTWNDTGPSNETKGNTFQLVLMQTDNNIYSFAMFSYWRIDIQPDMEAGMRSDSDYFKFSTLEGLVTDSNIRRTGIWFFRVSLTMAFLPPPVDAPWGSWEPWSACSVTCDSGTQVRNRTCLTELQQQDGATTCEHGNSDMEQTETQACVLAICTGSWNTWGEWSECPVTCGGGIQRRNRTCDTTCEGYSSDFQPCNQRECPMDGSWSEWQLWSPCSVSCGPGSRVRIRSCDGQTQGGTTCPGSSNDESACVGLVSSTCPVDGGWSAWSSWSMCPVSCGGGVSRRTRTCDNPTPDLVGEPCHGEYEETDICGEQLCPETNIVHGVWTPWMLNGTCSVTCGTGVLVRVRLCANPAPANGGDNCTGPSNDNRPCENMPCPENGEWGWWNAWGPCGRSCGKFGQSIRLRYCDSPYPAHGGALCDMSPNQVTTKDLLNHEGSIQFQNVSCNVHDCPPIHGGWGDWSQTAPCSATCGGGRRQMYRSCSRPWTNNGGRPCADGDDDISDFELFSCSNYPCPEHGYWLDWSTWSECSVTCERGAQTRMRHCHNATFGGVDCEGEHREMMDCDRGICHINGSWSRWSPQSACTVTCGGGTSSRTRMCDDPAPRGNGTDCEGEPEETLPCNTHECPPVDGGWSVWAPWGACSASCGDTGVRTRTRHCTAPRPLRGGLPCPGNDYVRAEICNHRTCEEEIVYTDGEWSTWTSWSICPVECGGGKTRRVRVCDNPKPKGGGSPCNLTIPLAENYPIKAAEIMECNPDPCPVHGGWGVWQQWSGCSSTCGQSFRRRVSLCDSPPPSYGGRACEGPGSVYSDRQEEMIKCSVDACPEGSGADPAHFAPNFDSSRPSCRFVRFSDGSFWPNTNVGQTVIKTCPRNTIGNMTRTCIRANTWGDEDKSLCTSASFTDFNQLDVAALQQDLPLLEYIVGQFVNECIADNLKVSSDLEMCCERFILLVAVVPINRIMNDTRRQELYREILRGGNELMDTANKPLFDEIVKEEEYTGTSIVTTVGSAFEDLVQEIANYMLQNDLPAYQNSLDNFDVNIDPVDCLMGTYTYVAGTSSSDTRITVPTGTFRCDLSLGPTLTPTTTTTPAPGSRSETTSASGSGGQQLSTASPTMAQNGQVTTEDPGADVTTAGSRRRRRQAGSGAAPSYYVVTLSHHTLHLFLPSVSRGPHVTPQPFRDPKSGYSGYVSQRVVASQPVYSKVLAGHSPSGNMLINFTHTLEGDTPECAYIKTDQEEGLYSSDGCDVKETGRVFTVCECPWDSGTFVLLLRPKDITKYKTPVTPVLFVALIIGIIVHAVIFVIYLVLGFFRLDRHFNALNFIAAFLAAQFVALLSVLAVNNDAACRGLAWLVHFLLLGAMFWLLCIAGYSFTEVRCGQPIGWCRRLAYVLVGWGMPLFVSIITAALYADNLDRTYFCWYPYDQLIFISYGLPLGITALMTIVILIIAYIRNNPGTRTRGDDDSLLALDTGEQSEQYTYRKRYLIIMLVLLEVIVLNLIFFGIVIPIAFLVTNLIQAIFDVILFLVVDADAFEGIWRCCHGVPDEGSIIISGKSTPVQSLTPPLNEAPPTDEDVSDAEEVQDGGVKVLNEEALVEEARNTPVPDAPEVKAPSPTAEEPDEAEEVVEAAGAQATVEDEKTEKKKKKTKEKKEKKPKEEKKKTKEKKPSEEKEKKKKKKKGKETEEVAGAATTAAAAAASVEPEELEDLEGAAEEKEVPPAEDAPKEEPSTEDLLKQELAEMDQEEKKEDEDQKEEEPKEEEKQEEEDKTEKEEVKPDKPEASSPRPVSSTPSRVTIKSGQGHHLEVPPEEGTGSRPGSGAKVVMTQHT